MAPAETTTPSNPPSFLEIVAKKGRLTSLYEAQDMAEIVFRTMRDLMDRDLIEQVSTQLGDTAAYEGKNKVLGRSVASLWKDSNPLVAWLSRIRPPFSQTAPGGIDDELFLKRVEREGGMPRTTTAATVVQAVFVAVKPMLSQDCATAVESRLPGKVKAIWQMI